MKKKLLFIFFLLINTEQLSSQIDNSIIITVGNYPITRLDLEKEMKIITVLSKIRINEENKKQIKDLAVQSLVKRSIKKSEIERLKITQFNKKDVNFQISNISKKPPSTTTSSWAGKHLSPLEGRFPNGPISL